jgi:hypothetical protein
MFLESSSNGFGGSVYASSDGWLRVNALSITTPLGYLQPACLQELSLPAT